MPHDDTDPETWDMHPWQQLNPVHTEALQLTCGGPQILYHGGLLHARLRYHDAEQRRPGLPPDVAGLVDRIAGERLWVQLVNTSPQHARRLVLQSGAFGEHRFAWARAGSDGATMPVEGPLLGVELAPAGALTLEIELKRFHRQPSYAQPSW